MRLKCLTDDTQRETCYLFVQCVRTQLSRHLRTNVFLHRRKWRCERVQYLRSCVQLPPYIPQTIEYSVGEAQSAMAEAIRSDLRRIVIELPMGRSRKYWYRPSPRDMWIQESVTLAPHLAQTLRGADIHFVLPESAKEVPKLSWVASYSDFHTVFEGVPPYLADCKESTVVFLVGATEKQKWCLNRLTEQIPKGVPVILLNCMMDTGYSPSPYPKEFVPVYMCRALKQCAFAKYSHEGPWHLFVEIAVFEYEWITDVPFSTRPGAWVPTLMAIQNAASERGAFVTGPNAYYKSPHSGCEAGFWPFMTIARKETLPLNGTAMHERTLLQAKRRKRSSSTPFGFF